MVGAFYDVQNFPSAKLLLNNKGIKPLEIRPTIYNASGQSIEIPLVTVAVNSHHFIDLRDWANLGGESFNSGSIKLFHLGKDLVLGAQIYLTDNEHSLVFEEKLSEIGKFDSRRQEAVWWMPSSQTQAQVVLSNTSDANLTITAQLARKPSHTGEPQTIELEPHQTRVLDLRRDFADGDQFASSDVIALSLENCGANDALLARIMLRDETRGYSNVVQFSNPNTGRSSKYQGVGFHIERIGDAPLEPVIVARNVGTERASVSVKIPYTRTDGTTGTVDLPPTNLQAGEMRLLNMNRVIQVSRREQIKIAGIEFEYDTAPGSVVVAAHSTSENRNQVFRVPMWDPFQQKSPTGGYPWRIEGISTTKVYIKNITDREQYYVAYLKWENSEGYMLGMKRIAPHETIDIDVKSLRDNQTPDEAGRRIPLDVSVGQFRWSLKQTAAPPAVEDDRQGLALIGRSEQIDLTNGIISSYACQNCCLNSYYSSSLSPFSLDAEVGDVVHFDVMQQDKDCEGVIGPPYIRTYIPGVAPWSSSNTQAATVDSSGTVTTVGAGDTTIQAAWSDRIYTAAPCGPGSPEIETPCQGTKNSVVWINAPPCGACSYIDPFPHPSTVLSVKPCAYVQNFRQVGNATDTGYGTLHFDYAWESSTGNLADLSRCFLREYVTYPGTGNYFPPSPPFPNAGFPNPDSPGGIPTGGTAVDNHSIGGPNHLPFLTPYSASSFTSVQKYEYKCPCKNGGAYNTLIGSINIVRSVASSTGSNWKYTITKSGASATIDPLPSPTP